MSTYTEFAQGYCFACKRYTLHVRHAKESDHSAFVVGSILTIMLGGLLWGAEAAWMVGCFIVVCVLPIWVLGSVATRWRQPPFLCSICGSRSVDRSRWQRPTPKPPEPPQTVEVLEIKPGKRIVTPPPVPRAKTLR